MKKKVLIVTGTPGTGKSTFASKLAKKTHLKHLDIHQYYKLLSVNYNQKKRCYDVDPLRLQKLVQLKLRESAHGIIIDSHISHFLPTKIVDLCIVLICSDLKKLQKRLQQRKYSQKKVRENLDAEIFQICLVEAREKGHRIAIFDTAKRLPWPAVYRKISKSL